MEAVQTVDGVRSLEPCGDHDSRPILNHSVLSSASSGRASGEGLPPYWARGMSTHRGRGLHAPIDHGSLRDGRPIGHDWTIAVPAGGQHPSWRSVESATASFPSDQAQGFSRHPRASSPIDKAKRPIVTPPAMAMESRTGASVSPRKPFRAAVTR
jgi:hypothetical protein